MEMLDEGNLLIPHYLSKEIMKEISEDLEVIDDPRKVYGKCLHGKGRVVFKNGNIYEGDFEYGMFHGKGKFT
jgi:hypothetical protein